MSARAPIGGQLDPPDGPLVATFAIGWLVLAAGALITTGGGFALGYGAALVIHASAAIHYKYRRHHH